MKFTIDSGALNKALKKLSPAAPANAIIPVLENVHCSIKKDGTACLTTSNTHLTISTKVKCSKGEEFDAILPFKPLLNISGVLSEPIDILIEKDVTVKSSKEKFRLGVSDDAKNYPNPVEVESIFSVEIDEEFIYYMQQATKCVLTDKNNYDFKNYVCIYALNKELNVVATDSAQIMRFKKEIESSDKFECLVDSEFIKAMVGNGGGTLYFNEKNVVFDTGETKVTSILSEQKSPNYSLLFKPQVANCVVGKKDLIFALDKMMALNSFLYIISISFEDGKMIINFNDDAFNKGFETNIAATHSVNCEPINLNAALLKNILSIYPDTEFLNFTINSHASPVLLNTEEQDLNLTLATYIKPIN